MLSLRCAYHDAASVLCVCTVACALLCVPVLLLTPAGVCAPLRVETCDHGHMARGVLCRTWPLGTQCAVRGCRCYAALRDGPMGLQQRPAGALLLELWPSRQPVAGCSLTEPRACCSPPTCAVAPACVLRSLPPHARSRPCCAQVLTLGVGGERRKKEELSLMDLAKKTRPRAGGALLPLALCCHTATHTDAPPCTSMALSLPASLMGCSAKMAGMQRVGVREGSKAALTCLLPPTIGNLATFADGAADLAQAWLFYTQKQCPAYGGSSAFESRQRVGTVPSRTPTRGLAEPAPAALPAEVPGCAICPHAAILPWGRARLL